MANGGSEIRYKAFLSYSHRDAAVAARLHRRLETYRIPKRLVGRETRLGTVPERLWPIFRDRDELPASSDLSESVKAALAESGALIVLCSPNAAGSRWIAREIETFRALRPGAPVLAAVLDGEPGDCFPAALRAAGAEGDGGGGHEPLATDLRREGDGPQLGLLKLVAGITGLGLDDLVQRDASRRVRRVTAVTIAALIGMLLTAALALVALDARREAERQRAEAEGLIEFMLTDLRTRLRGVGRLDVLTAVNERALDYYHSQGELAHLEGDSLSRRARILLAMGDDSVRLGDLDAALLAFEEARRTTAEQVARDPENLSRLFDHARSEFWIGRVHELRREWPMAQRHYRRFAAATNRLVEAAPNDPDHLRAAADSAIDLGNVQLNGTRDYAAAQRFYEIAVRLFDQAVRLRPRDEELLRAQANAYAWLADSFFMREMWPESLAARMRQHRIVAELHEADPENVENEFRLAAAERALSSSLSKLDRQQEASRYLARAFHRARSLVRHDPRNVEWVLFQALVGCDVYFGGLPGPGGTTPDTVAREIRAAAALLHAQGNPRASEFSNCLNALP